MNDRYKNAMDQLPFSDDLEARTLAMLEVSSAQIAKEEETMKQENQRKPINRTKLLAVGGSVLAAAACLVLVILPLLTGTQIESDRGPENIDVVAVHQTNGADAEPQVNVVEISPVDAVVSEAQNSSPSATSASAAKSASAPLATSASNPVPADGGAADWESWSFGYADTAGSAPMGVVSRYAGEEPYWNTEEYTTFQENRFLSTRTSPLSTFAADVDTASYAKLRASILAGDSVPKDSVRIEEMLNYFSYTYAPPKEGEPFGVTTEIADCPWNPDTKLLLVGLQAEEINTENVPSQNLVFLIDVSGSMDEPNKLPLVKRSFLLLLEELKPTDTVSIVTYAGADRVVLDGVRASDKTRIAEAIDNLSAGGSTAGAAGITTAYQIAEKHFIEGGNNRIILATDGDLNIGVSDEGSLTRMVEEKRKSGVSLSVLGYGMGNYKDNKLEALADNGNGNYAYIDTIYEARKALVEEMGATFFTVAKDVKLQVEFNPAKVKGYRLIGYENRTMAAEDFANDQKDGGEVGSGHRVTVLYELVPVDSSMEIDTVETKYQTAATSDSNEWLTVSIRAKKPDADTSDLYTYPVDESAILPAMSDNLRFASAVAEVGMLLRDSEYKGSASYQSALDRLRGTSTVSGDVYKEEFQYMVSMLARQNPETSAPIDSPTVDFSPTKVPPEDGAGQP